MLLAAAIASLAAPQAPALAPRLGREVTSRGTVYHPNVSLVLEHAREPDQRLYRRVEQVSGEHVQAGAYPAAAFAARKEGRVGLTLIVDAAGRLTGCTVARPSGTPSLDAHACGHLRRTARFHPALDAAGMRQGAAVAARLDYFLHLQMHMPLFSPGPASPAASPRRLTPLTPELIGIPPGMAQPPNVWSIGGRLAVSADGRVTACTLYAGTWDDRVDKEICDRLKRDARYEPARDRQGNATAGTDEFGIGWPRRSQ
jgi:TonB family protein